MVGFNYRELFESLPMTVEVDELNKLLEEGFLSPLGHINLFDTSSTNIRLYYSGDKTQNISFLPHIISEYIRTHGRYRGWIIGLPDAIKRLAKYKTVDLRNETIALERLAGIDLKGSIVDPVNPDGIWVNIPSISGPPTMMLLKPNINLSKKDIEKLVDKGDVDKVWAIVQEARGCPII